MKILARGDEFLVVLYLDSQLMKDKQDRRKFYKRKNPRCANRKKKLKKKKKIVENGKK